MLLALGVTALIKLRQYAWWTCNGIGTLRIRAVKEELSLHSLRYNAKYYLYQFWLFCLKVKIFLWLENLRTLRGHRIRSLHDYLLHTAQPQQAPPVHRRCGVYTSLLLFYLGMKLRSIVTSNHNFLSFCLRQWHTQDWERYNCIGFKGSNKEPIKTKNKHIRGLRCHIILFPMRMKSVSQKLSILLKNNIQTLLTPSVFYSWKIITMPGRWRACLHTHSGNISGTSHNTVFFQT